MSGASNQEYNQQNEDNSDEKKNNSNEANSNKKPLTFKDWKSLKESLNKANGKSQNKSNFKAKNNNRNTVNTNNDIINNYSNNGFNGSGGANGPDRSNFFAGNNGVPGFMQPYSFGNMNLNNNFGMPGNNCYGFNGPYNNFNGQNQNYGGNNGINSFNGPNNFGSSNCFGSSNGFNRFTNDRNRFNGPSESSIDLPNNFFTSDGIYRQKDLMQKPLPDNNPFRKDEKANQLLNEFDKSRYFKDDKNKKSNKNPSEERKTNSFTNHHQTPPENVEKLCKEPKVFVPNPHAKKDGKPYIPKPKVPEQNLEITKEEKKQQWKAYREAMKPFKNREFYNAKRVVQRLGKKDPSELNEKETIRLTNAREIMDAHKARLTAKYANYIKAEESDNELGELYVLKRKTLNETDYHPTTSHPFQNYGNFGESCSYHETEEGGKIVGGYTAFKGFVPGGMLDGTQNTL